MNIADYCINRFFLKEYYHYQLLLHVYHIICPHLKIHHFSFKGIFLKGKEKATVYRDILSRIHYFNIRADSFDKRIYSVQCAMNGGKISSNEFLITVSNRLFWKKMAQ